MGVWLGRPLLDGLGGCHLFALVFDSGLSGLLFFFPALSLCQIVALFARSFVLWFLYGSLFVLLAFLADVKLGLLVGCSLVLIGSLWCLWFRLVGIIEFQCGLHFGY